MKLNSFEFENFGRFQKIAHEITGNTLGFRGENYSGKSTIMRGIRYCIADELGDSKSEALSTFIRHYDPKGSARLSVSLTTPTGNHLEIRKVITNSGTERSLVVDGGAPIVKAKEASAVMAGLFGVDPASISKLCFVRQGTLANMLITLGSEREKLFMRVLDADYLKAAATHTKSRANAVRAALVDYRPALEHAKLALSDALTRRDAESDAAACFPQMVKLNEELSVLGEELRSVKKLESLKEQIGEADVAIHRAREAMAAIPPIDVIKSGVAKSTALMELAKKGIEQWDSRYQAILLRKKFETLTETEGSLTEVVSCKSAACEVLLSEIQETYPDAIAGDLYSIDLGLVKRFLKEMEGYDANRVKEAEEKLAECEAELQSSKEAFDAFKMQNKKDSAVLFLAGLPYRGCCDLCGTTDAKPDTSRVDAALKATIQALETRITDLSKTCSDLQERVNRGGAYKARAMQYWHAFTGITELPSWSTSFAEKILLLHSPQFYGGLLDSTQSLTRLQKEIASVKEFVGSLPEAPDSTRDTLLENIREYDEELKMLGSSLANYNKFQGSIGTLQERKATLMEALAQFAAFEGKRSSEVETKIKELSFLRDGVLQSTEAIKQIDKSIESYKAEIAKLEQLVAKSEGRVEFVRKLDMVAAKLEEIPRLYIRNQFSYIARECSRTLEEMESSFSVRADPEEDLSFLFKDNEPGAVWLPQTKLSGAMRVRLSLAFLIATQRILLPGMGFLVLDEPGLHLDDTGKKHLSSLLGKLGRTLFSGSSQIIVFDYEPKILLNCDQVIDL
jgi:DNA repair exonuclease SbcCD ATPase subunit